MTAPSRPAPQTRVREGGAGACGGEGARKVRATPCAGEGDVLQAPVRGRRIRALAASRENRRGRVLERALGVHMSNGKAYPAQVKFYSPPAYVVVGPTTDAAGARRSEHGRGVAILKIEDRELPVVRLARHSTDLHLAHALFAICVAP